MITSYVFFGGRCEEAIEFYKQALGAKVEMMMRFKESPMAPNQLAPGSDNKIMHATLKVGDTMLLMSDGDCNSTSSFQGFSLVIYAKDESHAKTVFENLSNGGQVRMPLSKTFFSPAYGMLSDKFGVPWMVTVQTQAASAS